MVTKGKKPPNNPPSSPRHSWLDVFHKGIWPFISITIASTALLYTFSRNEAQKKTAKEVEELKQHLGEIERQRDESEEQAQRLRERMSTRPPHWNDDKDGSSMAHVWWAITLARTVADEEQRLGPLAKQKWQKAREAAEKKETENIQ